MLQAILQGAWLGFSIAAPVGPIGILVLRQALGRGWRAGVTSGLGAALADLIYGCLAAAGVRFVAGQARAVAGAGGCVLLWLAWRSWRERPAEAKGGGGSGVAATFLLTLSNPMTILSFAAMVASTGAAAPGHFVAGVFLGSMAWWMTLSLAAARFGGAIGRYGAMLNRVAAVTLAGFGLWAICTKA